MKIERFCFLKNGSFLKFSKFWAYKVVSYKKECIWNIWILWNGWNRRNLRSIYNFESYQNLQKLFGIFVSSRVLVTKIIYPIGVPRLV